MSTHQPDPEAGRRQPPATSGSPEGGQRPPAKEGSEQGGRSRSEPGTPAEPYESDEEMLRRLLRDSVSTIEPDPEALRALREAVPTRRRRRQRLVAATTTVVALAVAAPVTLQAASLGAADDQPAEASHQQHQESSTGTGENSGDGPGTHDAGGSSPSADGTTPGSQHTGTPDPEESGSDSADPTVDDQELAAAFPRCTRDQLGDAVTEIGEPVDGGLVYGSIQLSNVSDSPCRIRGTDELTVTAVGSGMGPERVAEPRVVERTEGDRAVNLPLEDEWHDELVLQPGDAYAVAFAWVPQRGLDGQECAVAEPDQPPADTGAGHGGGSGDSGEATGTQENGGTGGPGGEGGSGDSDATGGDGNHGSGDVGGGDDPGNNDPGTERGGEGVIVRYTPAAGQPRAARFELSGSCSGSLHRTGVLEAAPE